jgi:hypothetical protein
MNLTKWKGSAEFIVLDGGDDRIISATKTEEGIQFTEECDSYFSETFSKEEAIKVVDELKNWINTT